MKRTSILFSIFLMILLIGTSQAHAQQPGSRPQADLQAIAAKQTRIMKERYSLQPSQETALGTLNQAHQQQLHAFFYKRDPAEKPAERRKRIVQVEQQYEQGLQQLLTKEQYASYQSDKAARSAQLRQKLKEHKGKH